MSGEESQFAKAQFAVGEVVKLKSGSADLTVTAVNEDLENGTFEVDVTWFDYGADKFSSDSLPEECFRLSAEDE
jgi:uncharacterized protein YodC (DUF2158 family)